MAEPPFTKRLPPSSRSVLSFSSRERRLLSPELHSREDLIDFLIPRTTTCVTLYNSLPTPEQPPKADDPESHDDAHEQNEELSPFQARNLIQLLGRRVRPRSTDQCWQPRQLLIHSRRHPTDATEESIWTCASAGRKERCCARQRTKFPGRHSATPPMRRNLGI